MVYNHAISPSCRRGYSLAAVRKKARIGRNHRMTDGTYDRWLALFGVPQRRTCSLVRSDWGGPHGHDELSEIRCAGALGGAEVLRMAPARGAPGSEDCNRQWKGGEISGPSQRPARTWCCSITHSRRARRGRNRSTVKVSEARQHGTHPRHLRATCAQLRRSATVELAQLSIG